MTDDLKLLDELGASLDAPAGPPAGLRTRVMATVSATMDATQPRRTLDHTGFRRWLGKPSPPSSVTRRWGQRLAAGLAVTVVIATAGSLTYRSDGRSGQPPASPGSTSALNASGILLAAAQTASLAPKLSARPDQFVFVESAIEHTKFEASRIPNLTGTTQRRIWRSVSGTRKGLLIDPGSPSRALREGPVPLEPDGQPAYRDDVPSDVTAALTFLYEHSEGDNPPDEQAFTTVAELIQEAYLPPASLAAVFAAAAKIPGVTVIRDVRDAGGRSGIAVGLVTGDVRQELIFDPTTHVFFGERIVLIRRVGAFPEGTVTSSTAVTHVAIVDRAGQLP
jgi:hypothetical protein